MDPEYPFVSGIDMEDLKNVILNSKNTSSVIIILDCCHAEIVKRDTTSLYPSEQKTRDVYAVHLQNIIESSDTIVVDSNANPSKKKIILASNAATIVSREKNDCIHGDNSSPHSHGAFSYYLIEGLDGKAADDSGIITIENIRRYIDSQIILEGKQKPMYYIAEASNIENIILAVAQNKFEEKINKLIEETDDIIKRKDPVTNSVYLPDLQNAVRKVNELSDLNPENKEIPKFRAQIDKSLNLYKQSTIEWLNKNRILLKSDLMKSVII